MQQPGDLLQRVSEPFCDVGIVSYDCFGELEACLESIFAREKSVIGQVFVIENSRRDIPTGLRVEFPQVHWHQSRSNIGFAKACNEIIAMSDAPYLLLVNPDSVIERGFLGRALEWMEQNPDTAVLGPQILDPDGSIQPSARRFPGINTAFFGRTSLLTRLFPSNKVSRRNLQAPVFQDKPVEIDWVSGACMVVRKAAIEDTGLMDEGFFMYWEDCDWCRRFRKRGWKIIYHPGLGPVRHAAGSSSRKARLFTHFHFHKSAARLYVKYDRTPLRVGSLVAVSGGMCRCLLLLPRVLMKNLGTWRSGSERR